MAGKMGVSVSKVRPSNCRKQKQLEDIYMHMLGMFPVVMVSGKPVKRYDRLITGITKRPVYAHGNLITILLMDQTGLYELLALKVLTKICI